jgi:hypothetical protein
VGGFPTELLGFIRCSQNPSVPPSASLDDLIAQLKLVTIHSWILLGQFGKF